MQRISAWALPAVVVAGVVVTGTAQAQTRSDRGGAGPSILDLQQAQKIKESRYQIGQIERVLEGAVEHGATVVRDRMQALMPADMLLTENARARGFRLEGYGVFFDVQVPSLEGTLPWSFRTLDQNDLGINNALQTLRSFVAASAANDQNLQQAMRRIELQITPSGAPQAMSVAGTPNPAGTQASTTVGQSAVDPVLKDPNEFYRAAIRSALIDAMLEHTRGLGLGPDEWLTVAARSSDDRPRLAPADDQSQTYLVSIRGADLTAFLAGQVSREETLKRMDARVF